MVWCCYSEPPLLMLSQCWYCCYWGPVLLLIHGIVRYYIAATRIWYCWYSGEGVGSDNPLFRYLMINWWRAHWCYWRDPGVIYIVDVTLPGIRVITVIVLLTPVVGVDGIQAFGRFADFIVTMWWFGHSLLYIHLRSLCDCIPVWWWWHLLLVVTLFTVITFVVRCIIYGIDIGIEHGNDWR